MHHRGLIPGQRSRALPAMLWCALLLSLAFAMPVSAAGPLKLTAGSADPDAGTAGDRFSFSVTYVSKDDAPPAFVRVILDGKPYDLTPINASDSDSRDGTRFRTTIKLRAAGSYAYSFVARDDKGREVTFDGGTVTVKRKPKPQPQATPKPTPKPEPRSTPRPTPRPTPTSTTEGNEASVDRSALLAALLLEYDGGPGSDGYGGDPPTAWPGIPSGEVLPGIAPPGPGAPPGGAGPDGAQPGASGPGSSGAGGGAGSAFLGIAALTSSLPGLGSDEWLLLAARSALISTMTAAVVAMALFTFKRRREDEDPFEPPAPEEPVPPDPAAAPDAAPLTGELAMPRWRRPSLMQARKADPGADLSAIEAERLTFAAGLVAGGTNERRRIRYRMVRMSDSPDEILGQEIGRLDEGDEVELIERSGLYWRIRTPLGEVGWIHKMTLGDVVQPSTEPAPADDEGDQDVLIAFQDAQARRGVGEPIGEPVLGEGLAARFIRERGTG